MEATVAGSAALVPDKSRLEKETMRRVGMGLIPLRADRSGERIWSTALPLALTSISFALKLLTGSLTVTLVLLSLVLLGNYAIKGPFFALATETLPPAAAAAGIAAINTLAHLGTGAITSIIECFATGLAAFPLAFLPLCMLTAIGCALAFWIGRDQTRAGADARHCRPNE